MRRLLAIVLIWSASSPASAGPELEIGLKGGPNAAMLDEKNRYDRRGLSGGLAGRLQGLFIDRFSLSIQMDLLYTPRGAEAIYNGMRLGRVRQHYLDVMISARPEVRVGPASAYLLLGGGLNFLLRARKEIVSGTNPDITGDLRRIDVALLGAVGVAVHLPRQELGPFRLGTVFLEARHDHGLIDTDTVNGGYRNRTSSLMLGMSFMLGPGAKQTAPAACRCP